MDNLIDFVFWKRRSLQHVQAVERVSLSAQIEAHIQHIQRNNNSINTVNVP